MQRANRCTLTTVALVAAGGWCRCAAGATLNVPGEYVTIQSAVDAAQNGDVVLVADGIYTGPGNWDIDFGGRLITVRSANGPEQCVIDGQESPHRGFYFHSGETRAAVVDGLTIRRAEPYCFSGSVGGGAIRCEGTSPLIVNCIIAGNSASGKSCAASGGGIYSAGGSPAILSCTIVDNTAGVYTPYFSVASGGGICCQGGSPTIANCTIAGNYALAYPFSYAVGGGVCVDGGATITNCTITGNSVSGNPGQGGGISCGGGVTVASCIITGNAAGGGYHQYGLGGGLFSIGSPTIINCTIAGNFAYGYASQGQGGGLRAAGNAVVVNCTFSGNGAGSGGGVSSGADSPKLINCAFSGNSASGSGGGLSSGGPAQVINCILWADGPNEISGGSVNVRHSNVQGGWPGPGANNIDADPLFVDADGTDAVLGTPDDDLRLSAGSPCIDAGINGAVPPDAADLDQDGDISEFTPLDLDGNPRFVDDPAAADTGCGAPAIVDMGAYEFQQGSALQPLRGDVDGDLTVGPEDLAALLNAWGPCGGCCPADVNGDGTVGILDFLIVLANWR